jgi:hypothetical protein
MTAHGVPDPAKAKGNDAEKAFAFDDCMRMLNQHFREPAARKIE